MAQDLMKLQKKKELPPIIKKEDDPAALFRSKADQVAVNNKRKLAKQKAEEAYNKAMAGVIEVEVDIEKEAVEVGLIQQKQLLKTLTAKQEELNKELETTDSGEKRPIKMLIGKNAKQIERTEEKIAKLEAEEVKLKG